MIGANLVFLTKAHVTIADFLNSESFFLADGIHQSDKRTALTDFQLVRSYFVKLIAQVFLKS